MAVCLRAGTLLACNCWDLVVVLVSLQLEFSFYLIISYDPIALPLHCHSYDEAKSASHLLVNL